MHVCKELNGKGMPQPSEKKTFHAFRDYSFPTVHHLYLLFTFRDCLMNIQVNSVRWFSTLSFISETGYRFIRYNPYLKSVWYSVFY